MIFAGDSLYYQSELWRELVKHKDQFLSEEVIYQYKGYIKTHMKLLRKHAGTPRERKIFYNVSLIDFTVCNVCFIPSSIADIPQAAQLGGIHRGETPYS